MKKIPYLLQFQNDMDYVILSGVFLTNFVVSTYVQLFDIMWLYYIILHYADMMWYLFEYAGF